MRSAHLLIYVGLWLLPGLLGGSSALAQAPGPLSVAEAVRIALKQSPAIAAARADLRAAQAETRGARAMAGPQVSANTFVTAGDMESMVGSAPDVTPAFSRDVPARGFVVQNVSVMVPIYTGGRLSGQVRAASSDADSVRLDVALAVKEAYYRALLAAELAKVAQGRLDADTGVVRTTQAQLDAGKGIEASVRRAEAEQADAQRELTAARNDQAKALLDLQAATGADMSEAIALTDGLASAAPAGDLNAALAEAARLRPELAAARARVSAAGAQAGAARGSLQPQVYGALMADAFADHDMNAATGYTAGIAVGLPLFDGGQRRAEVARATAMRERAEADAREAALRVEKEVRQAWLDVRTAEATYANAQAAVRAAQAAYDVVALRVQNQKSVQVELLDALAALTRARGSVAQALYDAAVAAARLERAVGR